MAVEQSGAEAAPNRTDWPQSAETARSGQSGTVRAPRPNPTSMT